MRHFWVSCTRPRITKCECLCGLSILFGRILKLTNYEFDCKKKKSVFAYKCSVVIMNDFVDDVVVVGTGI